MPISVRLKQQKTPGHFLPICKKVPGVLRHMQFFVFSILIYDMSIFKRNLQTHLQCDLQCGKFAVPANRRHARYRKNGSRRDRLSAKTLAQAHVHWVNWNWNMPRRFRTTPCSPFVLRRTIVQAAPWIWKFVLFFTQKSSCQCLSGSSYAKFHTK